MRRGWCELVGCYLHLLRVKARQMCGVFAELAHAPMVEQVF